MKFKAIVPSLVAGGVIVTGAGMFHAGNHPFFTPANASVVTAQDGTTAQRAAVALPDFSGLVAKYGPAVVNVSVTQAEETANVIPQSPQFDENDPFFEFFRRFRIPIPRDKAPMHGQGSGFIVRPDGIILTNAHVVAGASDVTVKLTDKREFKAKVVGLDKPTDVAVLKIDATNLPTVKIGNPGEVKVGEWVLAIGSPYGFENSVTAGIVSAKYRALPGDSYVPFIQTDVAVNPGNSGGPLFNMKGEVVGINSQIYSRSGGYQGLSFAIPVDVAARVENQLLQFGHVSHARLGVTIQEVNQDLANSFGLAHPEGALVSSVEKNSPAAKAGLEPGDVIVSFNGKEIRSSSALPSLVAAMKPNTSTKLEVIRRGSHKGFDVTLGELQSSTVASADSGVQPHGRLGLAVRPLTPEERRDLDVQGGLAVERSTGSAAGAGIQAGDVILSINGTPAESAEQLRSLTAKAGKTVALLVQRNDARIFIPIKIG